MAEVMSYQEYYKTNVLQLDCCCSTQLKKLVKTRSRLKIGTCFIECKLYPNFMGIIMGQRDGSTGKALSKCEDPGSEPQPCQVEHYNPRVLMAKWKWKTRESSPRKLAGSFPAYSAAEQEILSQRSRVRGPSLRHTNTYHSHDIMSSHVPKKTKQNKGIRK